MRSLLQTEPVDYGFLEWDGERLRFKETGEPVPLLWQRCQRPDLERRETNDPRWQISFEGVAPLENGLSAWLFCERLYPSDTWQVGLVLWVPCPLHPHDPDPRRCEYPALYTSDPSEVTHAAQCAGAACSGCWHAGPPSGTQAVEGDPGEREEYFDLLRRWSSLKYVSRPEVAVDHEDCFDHALRYGSEA